MTSRWCLIVFCVLYGGLWLRIFITYRWPEFAFPADLVAVILLPLLALIVLEFKAPEVVRSMTAEIFSRRSHIVLSIAIGLVLAIVLARLSNVLREFNWQPFGESQGISGIVIEMLGFPGVVYLTISGVLFEEFLYKALLVRSFVSPPRATVYVIASSVLFALPHIWQGVMSVVLVFALYGIPSALYYHRTRNLLGLIVVHAVSGFVLLGIVWAYLSR